MEILSVVYQPFAHTGVDYFGPLLVKLNKKNRPNPGVAKRYSAIFTCLSSRAHLYQEEVSQNLSLVIMAPIVLVLNENYLKHYEN